MIRLLEVKGLFGNKDKILTVRFNEGITILVGENGSGKTTILNIINAIVTKSFFRLFRYSFSSIRLISDEGEILATRYDDDIIIRRVDVSNAIESYYGKGYFTDDVINKITQDILIEEPKMLVHFKDNLVEKKFLEVIERLCIVISQRDENSNHAISNSKKILYTQDSIYFPTYRRIEMDFEELFIDRLKDTPVWSPRMKWLLNEREDLLYENNKTIIGLSNKDINKIVSQKWLELNNKEKTRLNSLMEKFFYYLLEPFSGDIQSDIILSFDPNEVKEQLVEIFQKTGLIGRLDKEWLKRIEEYIDNLALYKKYFRIQAILDSMDSFVEDCVDDIIKDLGTTIKSNGSKKKNSKSDPNFLNGFNFSIEGIEDIDFDQIELEEIIRIIQQKVPRNQIKNQVKKQFIANIKKQLSNIEAELSKTSQREGQSDAKNHIYNAVQAFGLHAKINRIIDLYKKTCSLIEKDRKPFKTLTSMLSDFMGKTVEIKEGNITFANKNNKNNLSFEDLSAGEKQLVTMFVYVKLALRNNSLIIIDEPELSLHVKWQRKFFGALTTGNTSMQYIISTHSPFIISSFSDNIVIVGPYDEVEGEEAYE